MAVTIKDVAAAAGVSPSTVSRTCKDSPSISRETKERVRRIMAQLGYEPNVEAEPVEAFSKTIGIILPSSQRDVYENAFHLEIIRGIGQFCNQRRYVNTVITGQDDAEVLDAIQSMVANAQADGFILLYSKKDCPVAAYLRSEGLLHVIVGKAAQSANQTIYIDNDNALAGEEATDYLYEMGHRRIAYFGVSNAMLFSAERKRGYQMSLLKHDITPREGDCVEIDTLNDIIFREVNNGVYKAGFARNQEAYEEAYHMVFNRLDWLEERLADRRYLFGDKITESDVRLYVTLARFDVAYHNIFRVNKKRLRDYDNLWAYARDLYQIPAFRHNTYFKDFAASEDLTHAPEDYWENVYYDIVVQETDWDTIWSQPTGREALSKDPAHKWKAEK